MTVARSPSPLDMSELAPYHGAPALVGVEPRAEHLRLAWADERQARFPLLWLRDHCACEQCRHPTTRERLYRPLEEFDHSAPQASLVEGHLQLAWANGHVSWYDSSWLYQRRPGADHPAELPTPTAWSPGFAPQRITHGDFLTARGEQDWVNALLRDGLALLVDGPCEEEEVSRLAQRIGPLRSTNFGARFDVRSKPNPNNAAYTAIGLPLHTDLPNWRQPPDIQLLYCLQNEAEGGESLFADGIKAVDALRRESPDAVRILSETAIDFRFQDETQDIAVNAPVLELNAEGRLTEIRFNNWIRDTLRLPTERIDAWYAAYRRLWELLHSPQHQLEFSLEPGQMIAFDNRRVLHGRREFNPNSGARHLQGTYLDRDMLESRLRVLARQSQA